MNWKGAISRFVMTLLLLEIFRYTLTHLWHLFLPNGSTMRVSGLVRGNVVTNEVRRNGGAMRKNSVICAY